MAKSLTANELRAQRSARARAAASKRMKVDIIYNGGGLIALQQTLGVSGVTLLKKGDLAGAAQFGFQNLRSKTIQKQVAKTAAMTAAAKFISRRLGVKKIFQIGPVDFNI